MSKNSYGKPTRKITIGKAAQQMKQQVLNQLKAEVLGKRKQQKKPKKTGPRPGRQNQTRMITDVPLGNSQRMGFNRNSASKTVTKDEYIADIAGTVAFTPAQYAVNPGQAATFPWLSIEAKQWEKYEFQKLEFYLKPEVTQYTTNANSGKVILSFDSDASDPMPANKQEAEDVMPMADGMSYQTVNLNIPKFILNSHHDSFYVRPGNLPGGADIKTYDLGNLFVSTIGQGGAVPNMMELRVRYTCTLMVPILENTAAAPQNNQVTQLWDTNAALASGVSYQPLLNQPNSLGTPVTNGLNVVNTGGSLVPPVGNYYLSCRTVFAGESGKLGLTFMSVSKNGQVLWPSGVFTLRSSSFNDVASVESLITLNVDGYISCNGTDAIVLTIGTTSSDASASNTTTNFMLLSV